MKKAQQNRPQEEYCPTCPNDHEAFFSDKRAKVLGIPPYEDFYPILSHFLSLHSRNSQFPVKNLTALERAGISAVDEGVRLFEENAMAIHVAQGDRETRRMNREQRNLKRKHARRS